MTRTLTSLAAHVKGQLIGNGAVRIRGLNTLERVGEGEITFAEDSKRLEEALASSASAIVVPMECRDLHGRSGIQVDNPKLAFALLLQLFYPESVLAAHVHPTAVVGPDAQLGQGVSLGAHAVLGKGVRIGCATSIGAGVCIGDHVEIGERCVLDANVTIYHGTRIGHRVHIHSGTVIGGDGFGYVLHQGGYVKVPQVGTVVIEDDVEIGCNVCVDRAMMGSTLIGQGTKIDNLVQVAHNDQIGKHVILAGQVGLSGSVTLGDYVVMGGRAGTIDHITIGSQSQVGVGSIVTRSVGPRENLWGTPALPLQSRLRQIAALIRLPSLRKVVHDLSRRLAALEQRDKA